MFHTAAFTASIANTGQVDVTALNDDILTIVNNHFQLSTEVFNTRRPLGLVGLWAGSATHTRSRLQSASLRQIASPYVRPIDTSVTPSNDPPMAIYTNNPLMIPFSEELAIEAWQGGAGAERYTAVIWLSDGDVSMPRGDIFTTRVTSSTAATANAWSTIALTWEQSFPPGWYWFMGAEMQSTNAIAHRWIFDGQYPRPGGLGITAIGNRTHMWQYGHWWGPWGRFRNTNLPRCQVLCNGADAAFVGHVEIMRMPGQPS